MRHKLTFAADLQQNLDVGKSPVGNYLLRNYYANFNVFPTEIWCRKFVTPLLRISYVVYQKIATQL